VGVFSLQKYFKIISKSLQKVVDKLKKMCYIIVTPNERGRATAHSMKGSRNYGKI
jgi:hypothetical protein